jgi:hypothetical protein
MRFCKRDKVLLIFLPRSYTEKTRRYTKNVSLKAFVLLRVKASCASCNNSFLKKLLMIFSLLIQLKTATSCFFSFTKLHREDTEIHEESFYRGLVLVCVIINICNFHSLSFIDIHDKYSFSKIFIFFC